MANKRIIDYLKLSFIVAFVFFSFNFTVVGQTADCLIPCDQIVSGGPPKDGIPSIDEPIFLSVQDFESDFSDSYLDQLSVLGVVINGVSRAYPRDILNWHEIVNDEFDDKHVCVTFCPLTGTGILYDTSSLGNSTLGTSGRLYENNLVFYDRESDSLWSQMLGISIKGDEIGQILPKQPIVESSWNAWKALHPDTKVLSRLSYPSRGFSYYDRVAYPGYRERSEIWFRTAYSPTKPPYNLYHEKDLTVVLEIDNTTRLFPFVELAKNPIHNDLLANQSILVLFDETSELAIVYNSTNPNSQNNSEALHFEPVTTNLPQSLTLGFPVYQDQTDTVWNYLGTAIDGPFAGSKLEQLPSYNAFWFAATALYPDAEIFSDNTSQTYISSHDPFNSESNPEAFRESSLPGFSLSSIVPMIFVVFLGYQLYKRRIKK
ncbi:MAG: DUF3179 domain-containing protein [Candidatus Hodarchaeales archaeon]